MYYQLIGIIGIILGILFLGLGMLATLHPSSLYRNPPPVVDYPWLVAGTVSLIVGIAGTWRVHKEETSVKPPPPSNPPQPSSA